MSNKLKAQAFAEKSSEQTHHTHIHVHTHKLITVTLTAHACMQGVIIISLTHMLEKEVEEVVELQFKVGARFFPRSIYYQTQTLGIVVKKHSHSDQIKYCLLNT